MIIAWRSGRGAGGADDPASQVDVRLISTRHTTGRRKASQARDASVDRLRSGRGSLPPKRAKGPKARLQNGWLQRAATGAMTPALGPG
jgi:hypothetical protein